MVAMYFYTIFLDYLGGTYISQVTSANPLEAVKGWALTLEDSDLATWRLKRATLLSVIDDGSLGPLEDRVNVWCLSGVDNDEEQLLLNVVSTTKNE